MDINWADNMRKKFSIICALALILCLTPDAGAIVRDVNDGFEAASTIKGRYFTIYTEHGVDITQLTMAMSVPPAVKAMIGVPVDEFSDLNLQNELDIIFLAVSGIMDIRLKKFHCNVKVCKDGNRLAEVGERLYGSRIPKTAGFYVPEVDTIYVDADHIDINVFGHELSHVIQNKYFVVPTPMRIQEVLAGFVEYQLRKQTNTLPGRQHE